MTVLTFLCAFYDKAVRFISDDQASFVSELGLVMDASPVLGAPRAKVYIYISCLTHFFLSHSHLPINSCVRLSQRFVIIANDDTIETVIVEENAGELTVTGATKVLALL